TRTPLNTGPCKKKLQIDGVETTQGDASYVLELCCLVLNYVVIMSLRKCVIVTLHRPLPFLP
ncbi:unnamed protein product, partial [Rotaria magnacalcarata]